MDAEVGTDKAPKKRRVPAFKPVAGWCLYDWANSSFPTVITTFVFANYFTQRVAVDPNVGTVMWGNMLALSGLVVALLSPVLGVFADLQQRRKPWLAFFTVLTVFSSILLSRSQASTEWVSWILVWVFFGTIGFEMSTVFYNALLRRVATRAYLGRVSGWAWGLGYLGGLCCLLLSLWLVQGRPDFAPYTGSLVGVWYAVFAIPLFLWVPSVAPSEESSLAILRKALLELGSRLWLIRRYPNILLFLLARMIYTDGLNTLFAFAGIYAAIEFNMTLIDVLILGIILNVTAGIGAASCAYLDDRSGSKFTVLLSLAMIIGSGLGILLTHSSQVFWVLSSVLGLFVGPAQASSRTLMARLAPKYLMTQMFGLYAFAGKATAFLGPWIYGWISFHFLSQRVAMASVFAFFVVGAILLLWVKEER